MRPLISLKNVVVRYKHSGNIFRKSKYFTALDSISLDIYSGETLGVLGGNGSGKSTLLKVLSNVIAPDDGELFNHNVTATLLALQVGFDNNLNGRDNAVLIGILHGLTREEIESHLPEIIAFSELGEFFFEPVNTYSAGMLSRLGFSIAIVLKTDVLLIDEVLSVGDMSFRKKAEAIMKDKIKSDQTVVIVSHSNQQIAQLCDRAVYIANGRCVKSGDTSEVIKFYEMDAQARAKESKRVRLD